MTDQNREKLMEDYKRLGYLTNEQFLAVKSLQQQMIYIKEIDLEKVKRGSEYIDLDDIEKGDTVSISITARSMTGTKEMKGKVTINDIRDAQFDPKTGQLVIDSDKFILTNIDCKETIHDLKVAIEEYGVKKTDLENMVDKKITLSDFQEVRDIMQQELEIDRSDMSLEDLFEGEIKGDSLDEPMFKSEKFNEKAISSDEIKLPELVF